MKTFPEVWLLSMLLLCTPIINIFGQSENLLFEHLTEKQGLSQNTVWSIHQDKEGFMWFGTQDGLNKYDGYNFTVLKPDPDDPENTLHHNIISDIHEDRKGRLWVTTLGGGLHQVDKQRGKVTRYGIKPTNTVIWNGLASIYEDQQGLLWISGYGGVASFNPETKKFILYPVPSSIIWLTSVSQDHTGQIWASGSGGVYRLNRQTGQYTTFLLDSSLARQPDCWSLYLDRKGMLWAGTNGEGLFYLNTRSQYFYFTSYKPKNLLSKSFRFNSFYEDREGNLWLSGSEGLHRINSETDEVLSFESNPAKSGSLIRDNVSTVYQDQTGILWIGTDNGIHKVNNQARNFLTYQIIPTLPTVIRHENSINTILEDYTGKIWLGSTGSSLNGNFENGLFQLDPQTNNVKHFSPKASDSGKLTSNKVWSLFEDRKKRLWVGTEEALHLYNSTTGKFTRFPSEVPIEQIVEDTKGKLWIGGRSTYRTGSGGIASFDPVEGRFKYYMYDPKKKDGLKDGDVYDILVSQSGDIWVALSGGGIARLNQKTNKITSYLPGPTGPSGHLNDKDVRAIYEDAAGVIWAGTNKGGLNRFDKATGTFTYFTMHHGLPSNHIESITGDERGNLWLSTNKGISRFNPKTNIFHNFDVSDGLPANEFRPGSVYRRNNRLMFGGVNGFVLFNADSIRDNVSIPPVYITSFKVMEKSRNVPRGEVVLPYDQNFLSFEFVALNYHNPEKNQYAYKLEGVDKNWIYSGTRRFVSYTNLDPGEYLFRVKGSNNDGVWNQQGTSVKLIILPPWWHTWWAYCIYALLGFGLIYILRQNTVKQERLKNALKLQRLEAEKRQEIDQMKSRFFANISHEFRTPLTLILGPLEKFISRTSPESEDLAIYKMMQRHANRLLKLINQLLDLSKLEAGSLKLELKPADIIAFLKAIVLSFSSLADSRQIQYQVEFPAKNLIVYFDADKLEKIVVNLLSNAFKFTSTGGCVFVSVLITEMKEAKDRSSQLVEIKIKDSGIGIPTDQLDKVFDRFYQVNGSQTRQKEGTGIGLALTKELIDLHGGEINITSQVGQGSTFIVQLPFKIAEQHLTSFNQEIPEVKTVYPSIIEEDPELITAEENLGNNQRKVKQKGPLLLLVEDNQDVRRFLRENLQLSYQIAEANNGEEGLKQALQLVPDLIVSDIMMPIMDGIDLCYKIKTDERTSHIPVILLTAKAGEESQLQGLETGADEYLTKPFNSKELKVRIKNLIEQRARLRAYFSKKISVEPKEITVTSADEKFLQRALAVIERHMANPNFDVEIFGKEVGMSRTQLHRKLIALTNLSASNFIRTIRLKRAAQLLSQKGGNVSEIAYLVGFKEQSYFSRCFHQTFGCSPSEYGVHNVLQP